MTEPIEIDVADDVGAELAQQLPGDGTDGDTGRGFACAGPFEHVADVVVAVFHDAGEIGVAGPRPGDDGPIGSGCVRRLFRLGIHRPLPVFPVLVRDEEGNRGAGGHAVPDTAERLGAIGFNRHASPAAVAALTAAELRRDGVEVDGQAGGNAFEDRDEPFAVRLAGGEKSQHSRNILSEISAHSRAARRGSPRNRAGGLLALDRA